VLSGSADEGSRVPCFEEALAAARRGLDVRLVRSDARCVRELPTGTVTFVFSDLEGSTRLLQELGDGYPDALAEYRRVLRRAFSHRGGVEVDSQGDALFVAFARATDALEAAAEAQEALANSRLSARMGVHTGEPLLGDEGYVGIDVHRAARIAAAGHGGQVLVSRTTRELVPDTELVDLGEHRLKDLLRAERIFQLGRGEFPSVKSLNRTNLPVAAAPLIGRARELAELRELVEAGARLITLTGTGGSGKTRLALQAAAELTDAFSGGVFFVGLASLQHASSVPVAVAQALGVTEEHLDGVLSEDMLLLLDNAEHLYGVAQEVARLLAGGALILVTSRSALRLGVERELVVEPLAEEAAGELFASRAAAVGRPVAPDETVRAICRRVDNLPLAVELAAARSKILSPQALLERLDHALPLLTGGASDAPARQRTLTATIRWSYDLLEPDVRPLFLRFGVFRGTFSEAAAEAVADATLDALASLVDHSLLKPVGDDRFLLLETLREFALEELEQEGELREWTLRHARHYATVARSLSMRLADPDQVRVLEMMDEDEPNFETAADILLTDLPDEGVRMVFALARYLRNRDRLRECVEWLDRAAESAHTDEELLAQARLYLGANLLDVTGDVDRAEPLLEEAHRRAWPASDVWSPINAAIALSECAQLRHDFQRGRAVLEAALRQAELPESGRFRLIHTLGGLERDAGQPARARELLTQSAAYARRAQDLHLLSASLHSLGTVALDAEDFAAADALFTQALAAAARMEFHRGICSALAGLAASAAATANAAGAGRLWAAVELIEERWISIMQEERRRYERLVDQVAGDDFAFAQAYAQARAVGWKEVVEWVLEPVRPSQRHPLNEPPNA
jgi:predicted ATPase/class 3 adenylate cyclase